MRVQTIRFDDRRRPRPRDKIVLGFEGGNLVERLEFILPQIAEAQTAQLMMGGKYANAVLLQRDGEAYYADLTAEIVGTDGEVEAYVQINGSGGEAWHSDVMLLITGALPNVEKEVEQRFPTAVETMLAEMAGHRAEMDEQEKRVEQAAQRAEEAAKMAEAGGGGSGGSGSTVEIDATLTQAGKAADAKATGEAVSKLSKEIDDLKENGGSESGAGLTSDAKRLLIQILRGGVYSDDVSVKISELAVSLGVGTIDYVLCQGTMSAISSGVGFMLESYNNRLSLLAALGELAIVNNSGNPPLVYPIPIPEGAVGVEVTAPSDFKYGYFYASLNGNKYTSMYDSGWQHPQAYPNIFNIPSGYSDGEHYMFINFGKRNDSSIPLEEYVGSISIKFVYE